MTLPFVLISGPAPEDCVNTGIYQRVLRVDYLFKDFSRVYVSFSDDPQKHTFCEDSSCFGVRKLVLSRTFSVHKTILSAFAKSASAIYLHSVYHAESVIDVIEKSDFELKVIIDIHGVVPEELLLSQNPSESDRYGLIERQIVSSGALVVMVSAQMERHFRAKYPLVHFSSVLMPIFSPKSSDDLDYVQPVSPLSGEVTVIYAGGYEAWQNVELMFDAVQALDPRHKVRFLSFARPEFERALKHRGLRHRIKFGTAMTAVQMREELKKAHYGFVLRSDSIVNQVSCPTKLVEYLHCGVIPVILSPDIGDFNTAGFKYVCVEDFIAGRLPSEGDRLEMVQANHAVIRRLRDSLPLAFKEILSRVQVNLDFDSNHLGQLLSVSEYALTQGQQASKLEARLEVIQNGHARLVSCFRSSIFGNVRAIKRILKGFLRRARSILFEKMGSTQA